MHEAWYFKQIGDGITAAGPSAEIEAAFQKLFVAAGRSPEMAVFIRHASGDLHCQVIVYFSPAAASIASSFEALPCEQPDRAELGLLAGDPAAWPLFFPA